MEVQAVEYRVNTYWPDSISCRNRGETLYVWAASVETLREDTYYPSHEAIYEKDVRVVFPKLVILKDTRGDFSVQFGSLSLSCQEGVRDFAEAQIPKENLMANYGKYGFAHYKDVPTRIAAFEKWLFIVTAHEGIDQSYPRFCAVLAQMIDFDKLVEEMSRIPESSDMFVGPRRKRPGQGRSRNRRREK